MILCGRKSWLSRLLATLAACWHQITWLHVAVALGDACVSIAMPIATGNRSAVLIGTTCGLQVIKIFMVILVMLFQKVEDNRTQATLMQQIAALQSQLDTRFNAMDRGHSNLTVGMSNLTTDMNQGLSDVGQGLSNLGQGHSNVVLELSNLRNDYYGFSNAVTQFLHHRSSGGNA